MIIAKNQNIKITLHQAHILLEYINLMKVFLIYLTKYNYYRFIYFFFFLDGTPSLVVEFKGHKEKINEVAWSPHRNLILLSCSNDFTAKVCFILINLLTYIRTVL